MLKSQTYKGFTLIEVMIAVFLLTVALLGTAALTTTVIRGNFFSQVSTTATTLAKDKMEELKAMPYNSLPANGTDAWNSMGTASGSYYTRTWTVTGTDPKTITVTVTRSGVTSASLKTIRTSG